MLQRLHLVRQQQRSAWPVAAAAGSVHLRQHIKGSAECLFLEAEVLKVCYCALFCCCTSSQPRGCLDGGLIHLAVCGQISIPVLTTG